jgi:hypothetical protein
MNGLFGHHVGGWLLHKLPVLSVQNALNRFVFDTIVVSDPYQKVLSPWVVRTATVRLSGLWWRNVQHLGQFSNVTDVVRRQLYSRIGFRLANKVIARVFSGGACIDAFLRNAMLYVAVVQDMFTRRNGPVVKFVGYMVRVANLATPPQLPVSLGTAQRCRPQQALPLLSGVLEKFVAGIHAPSLTMGRAVATFKGGGQ